jgi:hypothetical protein
MLNLAYKYVAIALMLGEANFFAEKTQISQPLPITQTDVKSGSHVGPPSPKDFGGSILTDNYFFGFGWGHLANFYKRGFMATSATDIRQRNIELSRQTSQIDSNEAIRLATNWLSELGVDLLKLESRYKRNHFQWRFNPDGESQEAVLLPVHQVEWRGQLLRSRSYQSAVVVVTVFGVTKELVELRVLDDSLFARSKLQIKERDKLLAIADDEFLALSATQRSNLVVRFAGSDKQEISNEPGLRENSSGGKKVIPGTTTLPADSRGTK